MTRVAFVHGASRSTSSTQQPILWDYHHIKCFKQKNFWKASRWKNPYHFSDSSWFTQKYLQHKITPKNPKIILFSDPNLPNFPLGSPLMASFKGNPHHHRSPPQGLRRVSGRCPRPCPGPPPGRWRPRSGCRGPGPATEKWLGSQRFHEKWRNSKPYGSKYLLRKCLGCDLGG